MRKLILIALLAGTLAHAGVVRLGAKASIKAVKLTARAARKTAHIAWKIAY